MNKLCFAVAAAALAGSLSQASAAERIDVGVLVCNVGSSIGMIIESKQQLSCTFTPTKGPLANYNGTISRIGVDLGFTGAGIMTWGVASVTKDFLPDALAGKYAGVSADIAVVAGVGANALVGTDRSFALNPISVEGNLGASLALGVAEMTLSYAP